MELRFPDGANQKRLIDIGNRRTDQCISAGKNLRDIACPCGVRLNQDIIPDEGLYPAIPQYSFGAADYEAMPFDMDFVVSADTLCNFPFKLLHSHQIRFPAVHPPVSGLQVPVSVLRVPVSGLQVPVSGLQVPASGSVLPSAPLPG